MSDNFASLDCLSNNVQTLVEAACNSISPVALCKHRLARLKFTEQNIMHDAPDWSTESFCS